MASINGTPADDVLDGTLGNDNIKGSAGDDILSGLDGNDKLSGDEGDDTLYGGDGKDKLEGDEGDDELHGGDGDDKLKGGDDNDTLFGDNGDDDLDGGDGDDKLEGGDGDDKLDGGKGSDMLSGGDGDDKLDGGDDDDMLEGGAGDDEIKGGKGIDTAVFSGAIADYSFELKGSKATITDNRGGSPDGTDKLKDVEFAQFSDGTIAIDGSNNAPLARDDLFATDEDTAFSGNVLADNGNGADFDFEGDPLTVVEVNGVPADVGTEITLPSGALLTLNADGTFDYDPNGAFESLNDGDADTDGFTYTVSDGNGGETTATATIDIAGVDDVFPPAIPSGEVHVFDETDTLIAIYSTAPGVAPPGVDYVQNAFPINAAVEGVHAGVDHTVAAGAGSYTTGGQPIDIEFDGMKVYGNQWGVDPRDAAGLRTSGSADESIVDGAGGTQVFRIRGDDIQINGFEMFNTSADLVTSDGLGGNGGDSGAIISYNIARNAGDDGLVLFKHTDGVIEYNRVYATNDGINIAGNDVALQPVVSSNNVVQFNEVSGGFGNGGIYAYGSENTTIHGNYVHGYIGDSGIVLGLRRGSGNPDQDGGTISDNTVEGSGENGIDVFQSDVTVTGNTVAGSNGWGVSIGIDYNNETRAATKPDNVTVEDNVFENNNLVKNIPVTTGPGSTPGAGPVRVVNGSTDISFDDNQLIGNGNANLLGSTSGSDILEGLGDADTFLFSAGHTADGTVAIDTILDYTDGEDFINLGGATVFSSDETTAGQVTLTLNGVDADQIIVIGVSAFADIDFI